MNTQLSDFMVDYRLSEELPQMPEHLSNHITKLFTLMYRIVGVSHETQQYLLTLGTHYDGTRLDNEVELIQDDTASVCAKIWSATYEMIILEAEEELQSRVACDPVKK